jgi:hypothetical protein
VAVRKGVSVKGSAAPGSLGARLKFKVWKRIMYDVVLSTALLYGVAFGPRSGKAMKVLQPA